MSSGFGAEGMTLRRWNSVLGAALLGVTMGVCGCSSGSAQKAEPQNAKVAEGDSVIPVSVAPVETRAVKRRVGVVGTLYGFEQITITPKVEGRIQTIHFDVGDRVPPNTCLLELDSVDYRLA